MLIVVDTYMRRVYIISVSRVRLEKEENTLKHFRVEIQYIDGDIVVYDYVTEDFWFNHLYEQLENDDEVETYIVDTLPEGM